MYQNRRFEDSALWPTCGPELMRWGLHRLWRRSGHDNLNFYPHKVVEPVSGLAHGTVRKLGILERGAPISNGSTADTSNTQIVVFF